MPYQVKRSDPGYSFRYHIYVNGKVTNFTNTLWGAKRVIARAEKKREKELKNNQKYPNWPIVYEVEID